MKAAVVVFPGSNCDSDCWHVLNDAMKTKVQYVWHKELNLPDIDLVVLPGGFSYGDYLRTGAVARFSPIMNSVREHAKAGKPVIGICNGFQILLETGLLPGAMLRNRTLRFVCKFIHLRTENSKTVFTNRLSSGEVLRIPIAHGEGNYFCDEKTLEELEAEKRIVFRYSSEAGKLGDEFNPNGALSHIAGIMNKEGNVLGMMPHPERSSEAILSSDDGRKIWESILNSFK
ncbi:MAG: phosphoribosylformylglycinamidine synthase I [Omnitrophica bacterium RIFCSPHIGHO2_02_FULL_46_11]|nr:MAG: phosphoribosylformylglycinamidine synthase I [Omnitrophica bacterium RIFCSPHIGHO2_02_FULL_46_11]OGW86765.1 MAG: phosphoribosylformylglycinamidine synthase I [Omnitrophica bacterium RIFCSPLOWO2_01_FULL_45_10b]